MVFRNPKEYNHLIVGVRTTSSIVEAHAPSFPEYANHRIYSNK